MADVIFIGMMTITIGGALVALEAREIVYGAVGLAVSFFGVASLFFLLDAPFVAVFQVVVYIGAVSVLILFTVMLVRQGRWMLDAPNSLGKAVGMLTAVAIAVSLVLAFVASKLYNVSPQPTAPDFVDIGRLISTQYAPALQVLALVLASSVVGAITLAKVEREADKK